MGEPLLKFRHLLEEHDLTRQIFAEVGALLSERKLLDERRRHRRCHDHRGAVLDEERAQGARSFRCTRPRKATNGISA